MITDVKQIENIVGDCLIDWEILSNEGLWVSNNGQIYITFGNRRNIAESSFDLEITGSICYLNGIAIPPRWRGKGHGAALYEIIVEIARRLGCERVVQMPSGTTKRGESRRAYLLKRGWQNTKDGQVEKWLVNTTEKQTSATT